ncbi:hypothetical protein FRC17_001183 [Serendipita sp. 399]|nr:hypothetical protein FRC17_001183 [Serendipita sp. 399]
MASIPLLSYDVFLNVFLTGMFVYPLLRHRLSNPKLRSLAKRTCLAASFALGTSVVNILILTLLHGKQLGWVCLASCGFDVTVNALVIYFITAPTHHSGSTSSKQGGGGGGGGAVSNHNHTYHKRPPTHISAPTFSVSAPLPTIITTAHTNTNTNNTNHQIFGGEGIGTTSILRNPTSPSYQVYRFDTTKEVIVPTASSTTSPMMAFFPHNGSVQFKGVGSALIKGALRKKRSKSEVNVDVECAGCCCCCCGEEEEGAVKRKKQVDAARDKDEEEEDGLAQYASVKSLGDIKEESAGAGSGRVVMSKPPLSRAAAAAAAAAAATVAATNLPSLFPRQRSSAGALGTESGTRTGVETPVLTSASITIHAVREREVTVSGGSGTDSPKSPLFELDGCGYGHGYGYGHQHGFGRQLSRPTTGNSAASVPPPPPSSSPGSTAPLRSRSYSATAATATAGLPASAVEKSALEVGTGMANEKKRKREGEGRGDAGAGEDGDGLEIGLDSKFQISSTFSPKSFEPAREGSEDGRNGQHRPHQHHEHHHHHHHHSHRHHRGHHRHPQKDGHRHSHHLHHYRQEGGERRDEGTSSVTGRLFGLFPRLVGKRFMNSNPKLGGRSYSTRRRSRSLSGPLEQEREYGTFGRAAELGGVGEEERESRKRTSVVGTGAVDQGGRKRGRSVISDSSSFAALKCADGAVYLKDEDDEEEEEEEEDGGRAERGMVVTMRKEIGGGAGAADGVSVIGSGGSEGWTPQSEKFETHELMEVVALPPTNVSTAMTRTDSTPAGSVEKLGRAV